MWLFVATEAKFLNSMVYQKVCVSPNYLKQCQQAIDEVLLEMVLDNNKARLQEFYQASAGFQQITLRSIKMSAFSEQVFEKLAYATRQLVLLNKGEFYKLIPYMPPLGSTAEIIAKLDLLVSYIRQHD